MKNEKIIILDCGSQYTQLIARCVREHNVFCEIFSYDNIPKITSNIKGFIISGSPYSVHDKKSPKPIIDKVLRKLPVLGICYGAQYLASINGGEVKRTTQREYGRARLINIAKNQLFTGFQNLTQIWMSHGDTISKLPSNFKLLASTKKITNAAFKVVDRDIYGIQFHPEVYHTMQGSLLIKNFLNKICQCSQDWGAQSYINTTVSDLKNILKNDKVVLGLSGGVDSTVAAMLLHKAIKDNLYCVFIDNGLLRKNEFQDVLKNYQDIGLNVIGVNSKDIFYKSLQKITDPEQKRKIIGRVFIKIFEQESKKIKNVKWLAQGTIYPDLIESQSVKGPSAVIKSHHNVGGLPKKMNLKVIEPLKFLFKDEVRLVGKDLKIKSSILNRHPFPGPGLAIRIIGEITKNKIKILQEVDDIFISYLKKNNLYNKIWQAFAVLLPIKTVGVMGDERTYENVVSLRAVTSRDGMTADWVKFNFKDLSLISNQIINNVRGVNRVVYDISSKPPATIEWE